MALTVLMAAAALNLIVIAVFVNAQGFFYVTVYQLFPVVIAFSLGMFSVARFMGWPL